MAEQTNLFSKSLKTNSNIPDKKADSADDEAYRQLQKDNFAERYHIYSANKCRQIIIWYLTHGSLILDNVNMLSRELHELTDGAYYHMSADLKCHQYNAWLMEQVDKSLKGRL